MASHPGTWLRTTPAGATLGSAKQRSLDLDDALNEPSKILNAIQPIAMSNLDTPLKSMPSECNVCLLDITHFDKNRTYAAPRKIHSPYCRQLAPFKVEHH